MNAQSEIKTPSTALEQIEAFERSYGYDTSYMKAMLEHAPGALEVFNGFAPMAGHRSHAPRDVYFAAKVTAYQYADCGPCLQLAIRFAREDGVPKPLIDALLHDPDALPPELARVRRFALATLDNDAELESLRAELEASYGKATLIELGLAIAAAQVFPVVKRAMGYFKSCSIVSVDN